LVLIDEAHEMTHAAELAFLSLLDGTAFPPNTIFVFTATSTGLLQPAFLSRLMILNFGTVAIEQALAHFLAGISRKETGRKNGINFAAIAKASEGNVRDALMKLELEIMAGGVPEEKPKPVPRLAVRQAIQTIYQERAAKAVATRKRRILEAAGVAA
jgi:DNA polymerase III gamma/tau subunit